MPGLAPRLRQHERGERASRRDAPAQVVRFRKSLVGARIRASDHLAPSQVWPVFGACRCVLPGATRGVRTRLAGDGPSPSCHAISPGIAPLAVKYAVIQEPSRRLGRRRDRRGAGTPRSRRAARGAGRCPPMGLASASEAGATGTPYAPMRGAASASAAPTVSRTPGIASSGSRRDAVTRPARPGHARRQRRWCAPGRRPRAVPTRVPARQLPGREATPGTPPPFGRGQVRVPTLLTARAANTPRAAATP